MKRVLMFLLFASGAAMAQTGIPTFQYVNAAPSGMCPTVPTPPIQIVYSTGASYYCASGSWAPYGSGGGASLPTNAVVYGLSSTTSRAATGNDLTVLISNLSGCSTTGNVYTPAGTDCVPPGGGGTPGGSPGQLQINVAGSFGTAPELNYDLTDHVLNLLNQNIAANGFATQANNQNSGQLVMEADVCTVAGATCTPAAVYYGTQITVATGPNPLSLAVHTCTSTSTGACGEDFNYPVYSANNLPTGDKSTALASGINVFNNQPGVIAQYFGAYGDAYHPPNGCSTTASSTTVTCGDGPFVAGDVGKEMWVSGAGPSGAAFDATITAVTGNTTVTVNSAAAGSVSAGRAVYGHDDTVGVQACITYSSVNAVPCVLKALPSIGDGLTGFLIGASGLLLTSNNFLEENSGPNIQGNSQTEGTNLFCEYNGDCMALASGPIQGANVSNIDFSEDPTQPASRGIHLNPQAGTFGNGPFSQGNFTNINVDNPALECLYLDGGGGPGYGYTLPNQYVTFNQFWCNGPNQSHTANLIRMTGQAAQILFLNGQVNGQGYSSGSSSNYPNPLVSITEKTSTLGDTPVDVKFYGFTIEVGTQGLYIGNGANNIHFDNSYMENISTPFIVTGAVENTFNGNHLANVGNTTGIFQFSSNSGGAVRDNLEYGGGVTPAAFAVCSGTNQVDFANNNSAVTSNSCLYTTAISSGTQGANSCSSPASQTISGLTTQSVITPGYSTNPTGIVGWGSTGGMSFKIWPSAANTAQWSVCNATGSSITYGAITFNLVFK